MHATLVIRSLVSRALYPKTALDALARGGLTLAVTIGAMVLSTKVAHSDYAVFPMCAFMLIGSAFLIWFGLHLLALLEDE